MRRAMISFLCLLVGGYVGLGLLMRGLATRQKQVVDLANQADEVVSTPTTPLFLAVDQGDLQQVSRLLKNGADPNGTDRVHRTPLLIAARDGRLEAVQTLVAAGAKVNASDRTGSTALIYAVRRGRSEAITDLLLSHGAEADHHDVSGESPLLMASDGADIPLMSALLAHGADPNMRDRYGLTPLMRVARGLELEHARPENVADPNLVRADAMRLLLQHGADVRLRDNQGWSALLYAGENDFPGSVQILLEHGADPGIIVRGRTLLRNAAYRGRVGNLRVLLAKDPHLRPDDLSDALMQSVLNGQDAAVQFLLDRGADSNYCDQYGMTPLILAIANDRRSIAKLLIRHGANALTRDLRGKGPLDYAPPGEARAIRAEVFKMRGEMFHGLRNQR